MPSNHTRRQFLAVSAAVCAVQSFSGARASTPPPLRTLTAKAGTAHLLGEGKPATNVWTFDGTAPGPILRLRQGEELAVTFANQLPQASAIHWHGIRNDNRMDGVPGLTQAAVPTGGSFDYRFTPPDAGTFWYHPHEHSFEQVPRGLTGALIVEEREPPRADQDIVLMINDWRLDSGGQLVENFGSRHDQALSLIHI